MCIFIWHSSLMNFWVQHHRCICCDIVILLTPHHLLSTCVFLFYWLSIHVITYRPPTKFREGNVFTSVCLPEIQVCLVPGHFWGRWVCLVPGSFYGWVYLVHPQYTPSEGTPLEGSHPERNTPMKVHPQKVHPLPRRCTPSPEGTPPP